MGRDNQDWGTRTQVAMFLSKEMTKQTKQSIRNLLLGLLLLSLPLIAYPLWDWNTEDAKVGDQLRGISSSSSHSHTSVWRSEHRRHYESFEFVQSYGVVKPQLAEFCSGPDWRGKDEVDFVEYENVGDGRVDYVRLAKSVDIGLFGDRSALKSGDKGDKPWAVVRYKNSWFDRTLYDLALDYDFIFPLSPLGLKIFGFLFVLGVYPFLKRKKASL